MSDDVEHTILNYICIYAKNYIYVNKQYGKVNIFSYNFLAKLIYTINREITILKEKDYNTKRVFLRYLNNIYTLLKH